jgi:hypothetical protein
LDGDSLFQAGIAPIQQEEIVRNTIVEEKLRQKRCPIVTNSQFTITSILPVPVEELFQVPMRVQFLNGQGVISEPEQKEVEKCFCFPRKGQDVHAELATPL